ncbi:hypothetical protein ACFLY6_00650 [Candidatus Dependentiae bacterium]
MRFMSIFFVLHICGFCCCSDSREIEEYFFSGKYNDLNLVFLGIESVHSGLINEFLRSVSESKIHAASQMCIDIEVPYFEKNGFLAPKKLKYLAVSVVQALCSEGAFAQAYEMLDEFVLLIRLLKYGGKGCLVLSSDGGSG